MRIVTIKTLKDYIIKHPELKYILMDWYDKVTGSEWNNLSDIKNDFNSVDYVGNNRYVFNIKGNKYRLVVIIIFISKKVYIRFIGTHSEYDKVDCKNI